MLPPAKKFGSPAAPLPSRRPILPPHLARARRRRRAFHLGKLFTLGISGVVAAFDASNGKLLWRTDAPAEHPYFSAAASPVGEKDLVITHPGNYGPLTAFDVNTGVIRWTAGEGGFFQSPLITELAGTRQVVSVTGKYLIGVSVGDGKVLWQHPWAGGAGGTMPILFGDTIIVSALNQGVAAFKPILQDGKWLVQTVWENKDVWMYVSNPVVIGDTLFGLQHRNSGQFFAIDAKTGKVLWLGQPREALNTAVVKAGDLLFLLNDDAELIVVRSNSDSVRTSEVVHRRRQFNVGSADDFWQSNLRERRDFAHVMGTRLNDG